MSIRKEEVSRYQLTPDEEALISSYHEQLPERADCNSVIDLVRDADRFDAEAQNLKSKLEGEKSKEVSLRLSLDQIKGLADENIDPVQEPKKSSGTALIGAGSLAVAAGIALAVVVMPYLAALSAFGAILVVLGIVNNNKFKIQKQAYESYTAEAARHKEAKRQRDEILAQLDDVLASIKSTNEGIVAAESSRDQCRRESSEWFAKWAQDGTACTEYSIRNLSDIFESVRAARKKQAVLKEKQAIAINTESQLAEVRKAVDEACPEIAGIAPDEALKTLRNKENKYKALFSQYQNAVRKERESLEEIGISREAIEQVDSPKMASLIESRDKSREILNRSISDFNSVLNRIGIEISESNPAQGIHKAEQMLGEYNSYIQRVKEEEARREQKGQSIERLRNKLNESAEVIGSLYAELELPERLALIRKDIAAESSLKDRITNAVRTESSLKTKIDEIETQIMTFVGKYGKNGLPHEKALSDIFGKTSDFKNLMTAKSQLEKQAATIKQEEKGNTVALSEEEKALRSSIASLETRRDELLVEYTQKDDFIRHADSALEKYGDVVQEINQLYEQKQKAQNTLIMLKRTIQLITKAKENLANRYLSKVEQLFNSYMHLWLQNEAVRGVLDIDFNVKIEENNKVHVAEGYSTGYCDLIDFCMRLSLVDTLFENEQPFLILDDPFVNLDVDRLEKALELLNLMAANKQIVYFVCHPIRAIETDENEDVRQEFIKLAEETKKSLGEKRIAAASVQNRVLRKSPKELYKVKDRSAAVPFRLVKKNFIITNNIFSMQFAVNEFGAPKDNTYELFFIDEKGHVLNERQILEISNGELSKDRITFSLNTREDSGNVYELMIRESGQDDFEVIARIPIKAQLAFASFDF